MANREDNCGRLATSEKQADFLSRNHTYGRFILLLVQKVQTALSFCFKVHFSELVCFSSDIIFKSFVISFLASFHMLNSDGFT